MKQNKSGFALTALLLVTAVAAAGFYFLKIGKNPKINTQVELKPVVEFASPSPISKDNSIKVIESELDNTVIVEEDFSDL